MSSPKPTNDFKFLMVNLFAFLVFLGGSTTVIAQQANPRQLTSQQMRSVVGDFRSGISQGCLNNPSNLSSTSSYCNCYAKSFIDRYSPVELTAISNQALSSSQASETISLMMRPEARACAVKSNSKMR